MIEIGEIKAIIQSILLKRDSIPLFLMPLFFIVSLMIGTLLDLYLFIGVIVRTWDPF